MSSSDSPDMPATALQFDATGRADVPLLPTKTHRLVEVVDAAGTPHPFLLDTGANLSIVSRRYLESAPPGEPIGDTGGVAHEAHGAMPGVPSLYRFDDLRIGALQVTSFVAAELELPNLESELEHPVHGVLGHNVLSQVVTVLHGGAPYVTFFDPATDAEARALGPPRHRLPFRLRMEALIEIDAVLQGATPEALQLPLIYDIGSPYTFVNAVAARASGIEFRQGSEDDVARGGSIDTGTPIESGEAARLQLETLAFEKLRLHAIDLPVFGTIGLGETPAGVLGNDLMDGFDVAIDYGAHEIRVRPPRGKGA